MAEGRPIAGGREVKQDEEWIAGIDASFVGSSRP